MTQTIEQLQDRVAMLSQERNGYREASDRACEERDEFKARVRELEAENASLKGELTTVADEIKQAIDSSRKILVADWAEQLAAAQLDNKRLRDALERIYHTTSSPMSRTYAEQALAQPSDTSTLDAYVAERVKPFQDSERKLSDAYLRIRELVGAWKTPEAPTADEVYAHTELCISELTRQRDLAVEALKVADGYIAMRCGTPDPNDPYADKFLVGIQSEISKAIKESEGK